MKHILLFFCWCSVLLLWGCAASVYINPSIWGGIFGVVGLAFPFCVFAVVVMLVICLIFRQKAAFIPLLGLIGCYGSVRDYFPINLNTTPPKSCLKVMSYNTLSFGRWQTDEKGNYAVIRFIGTQDCDLVAVQESPLRLDYQDEDIKRDFRRYGYYYEWLPLGINAVGLASRFPIVDKETICHNDLNGATAFYVSPKQGDTIIVVNAHLQSMRLSTEDRNQYHQIVKNPEQADTIKGKRTILTKIAQASRLRATEADSIAQFLDRHQGKKIILMGDFNDTPVSYAHHQVCSRLTDAYRSSGSGLGRSFNQDAIIVRIDNIFCSKHWKPYGAFVDNSVPFSDHYPIIAYLQPLNAGS